ncbi:MAG: hypothetical protein DME90_11345, partial [Verrucomicrobia bacterium]
MRCSLLSLEDARENRTPIDWATYEPPRPEFLGVGVYAINLASAPVPGVGGRGSRSRTLTGTSELEEGKPPKESLFRRDAETSTRDARTPQRIPITLSDLAKYIDWSPFFHAWELRGRYPAILDDFEIGKHARELFDDAQELLRRIVAKNLLTPRGVHAFWPANSTGDDVDLYADDARSEKIATFYF